MARRRLFGAKTEAVRRPSPARLSRRVRTYDNGDESWFATKDGRGFLLRIQPSTSRRNDILVSGTTVEGRVLDTDELASFEVALYPYGRSG